MLGEYLVIREKVLANQRYMVTLLLGTLAGMASSVVAYRVGSSNGSMQKSAALEKALAEVKSPITYWAVLVSAIVLVGFAVMLWLVIREEVPANQRDMVTLLLGTLAGMASSVVVYCVGSSNGSMQKNAAMERVMGRK